MHITITQSPNQKRLGLPIYGVTNKESNHFRFAKKESFNAYLAPYGSSFFSL
jgi:hypothetical protein